MPAPSTRKLLPNICISAWEKNWLIRSVSLLTREIRSPARFWAKNAMGRRESWLNSRLRILNSTLRPSVPIRSVCR